MPDYPETWKKYTACLRLYASVTPESAELAWREAQCFQALPLENRTPGHFYRFPHDDSLIEFKPDGSGQWHSADRRPQGFDPARVIDVPEVSVTSLRDELLSLLNSILPHAPDRQQIADLIETITHLDTPARAARLLDSFRGTLRQVPETAAAKIDFLEQAANQMVGKELLAGKVHGRDTAGIVFIAALAKSIASHDEKTLLGILATLAQAPAGSTEEFGVAMLKECWRLSLKPQVSQALAALQSSGNGILKKAQQGAYPEGHPEYCLEIYYGSLLQAIPYLLSAQDNYFLLMTVPGLTDEERETFAQRQEAAEERTVRLNHALLYAAQDVDQSRLREKQFIVRNLLKQDKKKAEAMVRQAIEFEYFYPLNFRSVLTGEPA